MKGSACNYQEATRIVRLSFRASHLVSKEEMHCEQGFCQSLANTTRGSLCQEKKRLCKQVMLLCSTNGKVGSPWYWGRGVPRGETHSPLTPTVPSKCILFKRATPDISGWGWQSAQLDRPLNGTLQILRWMDPLDATTDWPLKAPSEVPLDKPLKGCLGRACSSERSTIF